MLKLKKHPLLWKTALVIFVSGLSVMSLGLIPLMLLQTSISLSLTNIIGLIVFLIITQALITAIIVIVFYRLFFHPLQKLKRLLINPHVFEKHPFHHIPNNELGEVMHHSETMLRQFSDLSKQLKAHEAIFTMRLEERTKELEKLANYDIVTELPNHNLLRENINQMITLAQNDSKNIIVLIIKILNYPDITNALGQQTGSVFLKHIGNHLLQNTPQETVVAHISTTAFAIARGGFESQAQLINFSQWTLDLFSRPFHIANHTLLTTVNIGIAIYPDNGEDADTLLMNANLALNRAISLGQNIFQFYEAGMNVKSERRRSLLVDLHYALERKEFVLFYQPQINLQNNTLIGAEALLRWNHPEKGLILPSDFISLAEESGLIIPIGEWIIQKACEQFKKFEEENFRLKFIAVNLSAIQFRQKDIIPMITRILSKTQLDPHCLELEITESFLMSNIEEALVILRSLRALGVQLSIDDFGTGYSSLSYLRRFPVHKLKIDQSFIHEIKENSKEKNLADVVIDLANSLNLRVIAEGIETKMQENYLKMKGCHEGQGYLFGKPMPQEMLKKLDFPLDL